LVDEEKKEKEDTEELEDIVGDENE